MLSGKKVLYSCIEIGISLFYRRIFEPSRVVSSSEQVIVEDGGERELKIRQIVLSSVKGVKR